MDKFAEYHLWQKQWSEANQRENGWYPQPSTYESFLAGFEAAQKIMQAPNEQKSTSS